jgi:hypothetical protein
LPLYHPDAPDVAADGVVTVMVIPKRDLHEPEAPRPDRLFLQAVCDHLEPRRLVTTELHVRGPTYKGIWLSVGIDIVPGRDTTQVVEKAHSSLRSYLSSLTGGFDQRGWPLRRAVDRGELLAVVARVDGVEKVNSVRLADESGTEPTDGAVPIRRLELPRIEAIAVVPGTALPIKELLGHPDAARVADGRVPVPVIPEIC